jgi:hypothetical protein
VFPEQLDSATGPIRHRGAFTEMFDGRHRQRCFDGLSQPLDLFALLSFEGFLQAGRIEALSLASGAKRNMTS